MRELLLPRTDAGVFTQVAVVMPLLGLWLWRVRRDRDVRILATGVTVLVLALFVLRAAH